MYLTQISKKGTVHQYVVTSQGTIDQRYSSSQGASLSVCCFVTQNQIQGDTKNGHHQKSNNFQNFT